MQRSLFQIDHADARGDLLRDLIQGNGRHRISFTRYDRLARIAAFAHIRIERHTAEEWHLQALGHPLTAALAKEDDLLPRLRIGVRSHVFHDAQNWHFEFLEHAQALERIGQRHFLRRRDDRWYLYIARPRTSRLPSWFDRRVRQTGMVRRITDRLPTEMRADSKPEQPKNTGD